MVRPADEWTREPCTPQTPHRGRYLQSNYINNNRRRGRQHQHQVDPARNPQASSDTSSIEVGPFGDGNNLTTGLDGLGLDVDVAQWNTLEISQGNKLPTNLPTTSFASSAHEFPATRGQEWWFSEQDFHNGDVGGKDGTPIGAPRVINYNGAGSIEIDLRIPGSSTSSHTSERDQEFEDFLAIPEFCVRHQTHQVGGWSSHSVGWAGMNANNYLVTNTHNSATQSLWPTSDAWEHTGPDFSHLTPQTGFPKPTSEIFEVPAEEDNERPIVLNDYSTTYPMEQGDWTLVNIPRLEINEAETHLIPVPMSIRPAGLSGLSPTFEFDFWNSGFSQPSPQPGGHAKELTSSPAKSEDLEISLQGESGSFSNAGGSSETSTPLEWEHSTPTQFEHQKRAKDCKTRRPKTGRRRGHLPLESARKAQAVRSAGACLQCWLSKRSCTARGTCKICATNRSLLGGLICIRGQLTHYLNLFLPELLVSHLCRFEVGELARKVASGFLDNDFEVSLTFGRGKPCLTLLLTEFTPKKKALSHIPIVVSDSSDQIPSYQNEYPPPLAVRESAVEGLLKRCRDYVEFLIMYQRDVAKTALAADTSQVSKTVLQFIIQYQKSNLRTGKSKDLIDKALMLHMTYYIIGKTLTFTESDAAKIPERLVRAPFRYKGTNFVCRLLNRQIKYAINILRQELTSEILEDLERELKSRNKAFWPTGFCVISILCMCMEEAQISIDSSIAHELILNPDESQQPSLDDGIVVCRKLDELAFGHLLQLFHGVYKTEKPFPPHGDDNIYNPIRDRLTINLEEHMDEQSITLVDEIRDTISSKGHYLESRARPPSFNSQRDSLIEHLEFRRQNSGRLLSSFLRSFCPTTS